MNGPHRSSPPPTNPVDGGDAWRPSWGYLVIALACIVASLVFLMMPSSSTDVVDEVAASGAAPAGGPVAVWPPAASVSAPAPGVAQNAPPRMPEGDADPTRDLSSYIVRGQNPTTPEVIERLHQAGIYSGLGAFSLPGTRPPMVGIAVPEDFVLPEGYVRHHQATDDGQRIEAILMYAPDRQFFDAAKQPIDIPKNRVVPPENAPPGLPIRRIVIPEPIEPRRSGS